MVQEYLCVSIQSSHNVPCLINILIHQPRSLEIFESLGVAEEITQRAIDVPMFCAYKMPEGVETLREFTTAPKLDPTPDRPYVSHHSYFRLMHGSKPNGYM